MAFARAKSGEMRVTWEGVEYTLGLEPSEIPDALAANIARHVNVEIAEEKPKPAPPKQAREREREKTSD